MNENSDDVSNNRNIKKFNDKKKKISKRSESLDLTFFKKNTKDLENNEEGSSSSLNHNLSNPNSSKKFSSLRQSLLNHTNSMRSTIKKTTADFFGLNKDTENYEYEHWLEKRKRLLNRTCGKLKNDTLDLKNIDSSDGQTSKFLNRSSFNENERKLSSKVPVIQLAINEIKDHASRNKRDLRFNNEISLQSIKSYPQEFSVNYLDDSENNFCSTYRPTTKLPDDLVYNFDRSKTFNSKWRILNDDKRRIKSELIDSIFDNSDRRLYGMGIVGRLLNRKFRSNLTSEERYNLNSIDDNRPYFTLWVTSVQIMIMVISLIFYGLGPFGLNKVKYTDYILVTSLSQQQVGYFEPNNIWFGPRAADLIHLGAKFTPCMRTDKLITDQIAKEKENEKETACCIRTDKAGCVQTSKEQCSKHLSVWHKWTEASNITYLEDGFLKKRTSGTVCGQDPRHCKDPASIPPNNWPDDITKWPICHKSLSGLKKNYDSHMSCNIVGKPCCIGIHGECKITTKDYCDFVKGFFHEEATLCSQVSCMSDVCGMLQIKRDDNLLQFYRVWTSLFIHAGLLHIAISATFQFYIMTDFEKLIGPTRMCIIYMLSGIGGNLASSIFVPYRAEVGPGGSQFGILAGIIAEVIHNWNIIEKPWKSLFKLIGIAFALFFYGLLPWIDNYAHLFGFIIGFLLSLALLPFLTLTKIFNRRIKLLLSWFCCSFVIFILFILVLFLYTYPIYDCKFCSYFNCIPFTEDWCTDHYIEIKRKDIL